MQIIVASQLSTRFLITFTSKYGLPDSDILRHSDSIPFRTCWSCSLFQMSSPFSFPPTTATYPTTTATTTATRRGKPPPINISTNPADLDPARLRDLLRSAGLSCHRFPALSPDGRPLPVDLHRLRLALSNSSVVVSAFCRSRFLAEVASPPGSGFGGGFEELVWRAFPIPDEERELVGFGRAVSDGGLTASIHDVVVIPSMQRLGIGRKIINRIIRLLTSKEIYDISALCSEKERLFFKACGFGSDSLGATTMMYTRTTSVNKGENVMVKHAGRMPLLVPPPPEMCMFRSIAAERDGQIEIEI